MEVTVAFIDENKDELGVEPICRELQVAPSTYYSAKKRPLSARAVRDAVMLPILVALWMIRPGIRGGSIPWKRGWSHATGTTTQEADWASLHP